MSSMGGWKLGLRAGWNGAAARRSRSAITWGGLGGLWMRDSRIPASVVAKFRIAACNFRSRFGSARRAQHETAWRAQNEIAWRPSYYFHLEKHTGNTTGTRAWKGSRVRQAVRIWERFGASLHHPFYPCHSVTPPRTFHIRYQIGIDRCASPARACARPHHHPIRLSLTFHPPQHTFYPPAPHQPPTRPVPLYCSPSCSYATISSYARILACTSLPKIFPCHAISHGRCVKTIL